MNCPKCVAPMIAIEYGGAVVDRCSNCHGIFFDEFEKEDLRLRTDAALLDRGDAKVGEGFNTVDRIQCPRCGGRMIRMVDAEQPHIWFEQCKVCGGSFFDAGEFRDLADHTVMDWFRDMRSKERK